MSRRRRSYIAEPGAYDGVPAAIYHSHITPAPALNASGAWDLESECPAFYYARASFNPAQIVEESHEFDIGKASHLIVLEPKEFDRRVAIIDLPDYRSLEAQQARRLYRQAGRIPLLEREHEMLLEMRTALRRHEVGRFAFKGGKAERSYFWIDAETGIWCKARPDYTLPHGRYAVDYKTSTSANPEHFSRVMRNLGHHLRAAWYLDAYEAVEGRRPERFHFIVQSTRRPHLVAPIELDPEAEGWGRLLCRHARQTFRRCLETKDWPGYRPAISPETPGAIRVGLPGWYTRDLQARLDRGEFATPLTSPPETPQ